MFTIKSILYWNILSLILAQSNQHLGKSYEESDPIIEPPELVLRSTDNEGFFYCNSQVDIKNQKSQLMAITDYPILTPPSFILKTEQANATTIRIRIQPNGYIGINRINCHWSNNVTYGQTADLIIGENPGVIQLKENCLAYDRRYVQCIFRAETIARAFQNGFPRLFTFSEMNFESNSYRSTPTLVNITKENELVFHFEPRDRYVIPKKISMTLNMTLRRFGSSIYRFNIEPLHTTEVDFQFENISKNQFTILVNHNNTGTISQRLCSGHISKVNNQDAWITVQDIIATTEQKILINRLSSSTQYEVCLRCFYEQSDKSFKEEKCHRVQTTTIDIWFILICGGLVAAASTGLLIGLILYRSKTCKRFCNRSSIDFRPTPSLPIGSIPHTCKVIDLSERMKTTQFQPDTQFPGLRYTSEPGTPDEVDPLCEENGVEESSSNDDKYQHLNDTMQKLTDENNVSPDTVDLTRQTNAQ